MAQAGKRRRPRRSREEVLGLIRASALHLFAERGYAGTTTQEIARRADVSETLLFRHFGDKAGLYDAVVSAPFRAMMETFGEGQATAASGAEVADGRHMIAQLYDFFAGNREVFSALVLGAAGGDGADSVRLTGLDETFRQAAGSLEHAFAGAGVPVPFDPDLASRLIFGMVAASVLLRPLLFSARDIDPDRMRDTIATLARRALYTAS